MVGRLMIRILNFFPGNELVSASRPTGRVLEEIYLSSDQFINQTTNFLEYTTKSSA